MEGSNDRVDEGDLKVRVINVDSEPGMTISLSVDGAEKNLSRAKDEALQKALFRLQKAVDGGGKKKKTKGKNSAPAAPSVPVELVKKDSGHPVDPATPNEAAWDNDNVLRIGDRQYDIEVNPPTVNSIALPPRPMVGYPVMPVIALKFADEAACRLEWSRQPFSSGAQPTDSKWEVCGEGRYYTPSDADEGFLLRVVCTPRSAAGAQGQAVAAEASQPVSRAPGTKPFRGRADHTRARVPAPAVRVVTYNILADQYAGSRYAREVLFDYCAEDYLDPFFRRQRVLEELRAYNADVVCCQEVDQGSYDDFFGPMMSAYGFESRFDLKAGSVREGEAMFWRRDRYRAVDNWRFAMKDMVEPEDAEAPSLAALPVNGAAISAALAEHPHLVTVLKKVTQILQLVLLEPVAPDGAGAGGPPLLVANTHLFFHPRASHVRTVHVATMVELANAVARERAAQGERRPALLFCGDFNADLNDGMPALCEMLQTGSVGAGCWDWKDMATFSWGGDDDEDDEGGGVAAEEAGSGGEESAGPGIALSVPVRMRSADDLATPWTNYTRGYTGLLDYIWYDPSVMRRLQYVSVPPEADLKAETAIPSSVFPSDHVAVVADLEPPASLPLVVGADAEAADAAASACIRGGVVAVPTDTLYGLACLASDAEAVRRIYEIKGRSFSSPLAICVAEAADAVAYGDCSGLPGELLEELLPGPVTLVLPRLPDAAVAAEATQGVATIAVRVPGGDEGRLVRSVCRRLASAASDTPAALALTSANLSGGTSPLHPREFEELWGELDVLCDAGEVGTGCRNGSTIVDLSRASHGAFKIIREGSAPDMVRAAMKTHGLVEAK